MLRGLLRACAVAAVAFAVGSIWPGSAMAVSAFTLNSSSIQVVHFPGYEPIDTVNMALTFTNNGDGLCDAEDNPITNGIRIVLEPGTCMQANTASVDYTIPSFVPHMQSGVVTYGTYAAPAPPTPPIPKIVAKIVVLATPMGTCGKWTLYFQMSKVDLSAITSNPVALSLADADDATCFDISNALIGGSF